MRVESPSSLREGCSVSTGIRLVMWVRSPKFLVKLKSQSRILGDVNSIPSGGGVPEGRRGSLTPMSEDGSLCLPLSTPNSLSEHPRDEKYIRSVPERDEAPRPRAGGFGAVIRPMLSKFTDGDILMKCAKEPLPRGGAYLST